MKLKIRCYECDSEYEIQAEPGCLADEIKYCIVCSAEIDQDPIEDEEIESEEE